MLRSGKRLLRVVVVLTVLAGAECCGLQPLSRSAFTSHVSALAVNFFEDRGVAQIVLYICDQSDRVSLLQLLARNGRFQVEAPHPTTQLTGDRLLRHQPAVGLLLWNSPTCKDIRIDEVTDRGSYNGSFRWLLVGSFETIDLKSFLRLDTEITIARPLPENQWELVEVYRAGTDVIEVQVEPFTPRAAGCDSKSPRVAPGVAATRSAPRYPGLAVRRRNVPGVPVRAVLTMLKIVEPAVMQGLIGLSRAEAGHLVTLLNMYSYIIFMNVVARYNMSVTKMISTNTPGQTVLAPGEIFDGLMGVVQRGEADVGAGVGITLDRVPVMVFSVTSWSTRTTCGFLSNSVLGTADALVKPFNKHSWVVVIVFAVVFLVCGKCFRSVEKVTPVQRGISWSDAFISWIGTFTGQGFNVCGDWVSGRALLLAVEVFFFLTQAYYGAAIVTALLRPPPNTIRTLQDLVKSHYKGVSHNWIHTRRTLESSADPLLREVYLRKLRPPRGLGFQDREGVADALQQPSLALFGADDVVDEAAMTLTAGQTCRLVKLDVDTPILIALGTAKDAPFKEMMHAGTLIQVERGIAYREKWTWRQPKPVCQGSGGDGFAPVEGLPLLPAFALLSAGLAVSAALCLAELATHREGKGGKGYHASRLCSPECTN